MRVRYHSPTYPQAYLDAHVTDPCDMNFLADSTTLANSAPSACPYAAGGLTALAPSQLIHQHARLAALDVP